VAELTRRGFLVAGTATALLATQRAAQAAPLKVAGIHTVPVENPWNSRLHAAMLAADKRGDIKYVFSENISNTDYERAMREAKLQVHASELQSREGEEMGYLAAKLVLQQSLPTAIFAGDDAAARGVYKAARDRGLSIPEDLSVAGFNDTPEAAALHPPLTSVHVFTDELGKQLAEVLLKRITRPDLVVRDLTLPTQVIRRESCASVSPNHSSTQSLSEFGAPSVE